MPPLNVNGFLDEEINSWVKQFRSKHAPWFQLADQLNRDCHSIMFKIDAHSRDMEEVLIATLYIRTMGTFQAIVILAERGMIAQAKMLARCMFDSIFPLCAISKDQEHKYFREYISSDLSVANC